MAQDDLATPTETPDHKFRQAIRRHTVHAISRTVITIIIPTSGHIIRNIFGLASLVGQKMAIMTL